MPLLKKLKWLDPFTYLDLALEKLWPKRKNDFVQELAYNVVYFVFAFAIAFAVYSSLALAWQTPSPMVIVVSGSMEPVLFRGDVVFLHGTQVQEVNAAPVNLDENLSNAVISSFVTPAYANGYVQSIAFDSNQTVSVSTSGDIVVYSSPLLGEQVIHRAVVKIQAKDGTFLLTKGDSVNNYSFDQDCGKVQLLPLEGGTRVLTEKPCISPFAISQKDLQGRVQFGAFKIPYAGCVKLWLVDDLVSLVREKKLPSHFKGIC